jgi:hypothetical protein
MTVFQTILLILTLWLLVSILLGIAIGRRLRSARRRVGGSED